MSIKATPTRICLLRGVNLGAARRVGMAEVCAALAATGFGAVRSLLQSGNLVFEIPETDAAAVEARVEAALAERLGLVTEAVVRTPDAWRAMIAANPFVEVAAADPARLVAMVLKADPAEGAEAALAAVPGPEQARVIGRTAFIWYPAGQADTKLAGAVLDRALGARGTGRNWNTVRKLAAMIEA